MKIALKEWSVIVSAIREGRHQFLLRKGGLADRGGSFKLDHTKFLFFPTTEHQSIEMVKENVHSFYQKITNQSTREDKIIIDTWAEVRKVFKIENLESLQELSDYSIWSDHYFKMRLSYKPEKPLFLILLKSYRLKVPQEIPSLPRYGGCRSWLELDHEISLEASTPIHPASSLEKVTQILQKV